MEIVELAARLQAQLDPMTNLEILGVAPIDQAQESDITFLANPKYAHKLQDCQAGAILVNEDFEAPAPCPLLRVKHPYLAFAQAIELFYPPTPLPTQIHPTAVIGQNVRFGQDVAIGAYVVIGDNVVIGDRVTVHPHCVIYQGASLGDDTLLHSHVVIREQVKLGNQVIIQNGVVIGADGYGFVTLPNGQHHKIPQVGTVVIEDQVEIQANTTIDRATLGETRLGKGTKVDNLVQIAHNCTVGQHSLLCGQVGLAGSTQVGNHVVLAGQVGAAGHLSIGDGTMAGAKTGINNSLPAGSRVSGYPAMDHKLWLRMVAELKQLPQLIKRLRKLENQLSQD
ncbi:UDP-3-O-(3-hydroxymyristoyl)glucosamine N-acyltransferase [Synechococcus sp. PCC 6312]|uniref:UDP-3-O-(3-hydroxymyristoyl)glucosamine N-acyltransferase n=1 Tax=Synechococcus sp. (strain ATCC 27167 / PCC 6312) TaxID=195253 RepID=UPI00029F45E9|nr:UDP-3-O-(3-hydroxymyristoyl)glucosamine N-acyltransferase [Synechococcus sp. PCC 6312]AFY59823.1 UDP-3-O-(3-hydroxymyristoyl) glucosamine N-acyltransferase [Synechococcus sp. PCC 6312]